MIPAGDEYQDEHSRTVYFIDRNGESFHYILDFLRKGSVNVPSYASKPHLWKDLREEAMFYCINGLCNALYTTHEIKLNREGRGIFFWLGTKKGKDQQYQNPYGAGLVNIVDGTDGPIPGIPQNMNDYDAFEYTPGALIQFRAPVMDFMTFDPIHMDMCFAYKRCGYFKGPRFAVVVDLQTIKVRPTAYSLRLAGNSCRNWNLEASLDGSSGSWHILHAARDDEHLTEPSGDELACLSNRMKALLESDIASNECQKEAYDLRLAYAEEKLRHTWDIHVDGGCDNFYQFFRLTSMPDAEVHTIGLDAVGFELYGEIHEE